MVDLRALGECLEHTPLKPPEFGFQSTDSTIVLALAQQVREVVAQVGVGEPPEVSLTAETRPLARMASIRTSLSESSVGRASLTCADRWRSRNQSSTRTYSETKN